MDNLDIDKLLSTKANGAHRKKILLSVVTVILCAGLITGGCFGVKSIINAGKSSPTEKTEKGDKEQPKQELSADDKTPDETPKADEKKEIEHSLKMIWFGDEGYSQFDRIAINVMHGEEVVRSFSLSAENEWKCSWSDEYEASELTLAGLFPDGVTAEFSISGENFVISSTYTPVEGENAGNSGQSESSNGQTAGGGNKNIVDDNVLPQTGINEWLTLFLMGFGTVIMLFGFYEFKKPERL